MIAALRIVEATVHHNARVLQNLRDWNARELKARFGCHWRCDASRVLVTAPGFKYAVLNGNKAIAVCGAIEIDARVWKLYMIASDAIDTCARPLARLLRRKIQTEAKEVGVTTLEADALTGNPLTPRWFAFLGARVNRREGDFDVYRFDLGGDDHVHA